MKRARNLFKVVLAAVVIMSFMMAVDGQRATFAAEAKGIKLPADGGEPGRDYMTYVKAVHKRDGATIRKMAEIPAGTSDKQLKAQMEMAAAMTPTDQKIISGSINKNTATLNVTGVLDKKKQYGAIELQKKGGVWKITKEAWSESPKK